MKGSYEIEECFVEILQKYQVEKNQRYKYFITIDGKKERVTPTEFIKKYSAKAIREVEGLGADIYENQLGTKDIQRLWVSAFKIASETNIEYSGELMGFLSHVEILIDQSTGEEYVYDLEEQKISDIGYEALIKKEGKKAVDEAHLCRHFCKLVFNPYSSTSIHEELNNSNFPIKVINTYECPAWRHKEVTPCLPPRIKELMKHIFVTETNITYIYDWIKRAVFERNEIILIINGTKGLGKGVLSEVLRELVGGKYFLEAKDSLITGTFNAGLKDMRLILVDEETITKQGYNRLKRYTNQKQNIEEKGKDANKSIDTFNSFLITSNDITDMKMEHDDRRCSVPDVNKEKLSAIWTEEETREFIEDIKDPDSNTIAQFGFWLKQRVLTTRQFEVLRGEHFKHLVYATMPVWERFLIAYITRGVVDPQIHKGKLDSAITIYNGKSSIPSPEKVKDFLSKYKHEDKYFLGELKEGPTDEQTAEGELEIPSWFIEVSPRYIKSPEKEIFELETKEEIDDTDYL